ncbi:DUF6191 domain-containing protein, partial [Streptomyces longispororuber]|uniref:DUF6191 domain-containing protein n=1 Tax=Streptomyces longispororuber TaxID=68230 RepID=UPI00167CE1FD
MFNVFEQLFAPGRKHTDDEKKRLELTRVDVNDGDPGHGPIDLSSGKVLVRLPQQPDDTPAPHPEAPPAVGQAPADEATAEPAVGQAPADEAAAAPAADHAPPDAAAADQAPRPKA